MSEYFERLDTNNYNSEFEYYLQNDFYTLEDWHSFYRLKNINFEQWNRCRQYFLTKKSGV